MIKIKRLKQNSETIYPITHENAVYDSNGIAISDKYMTKTEGHNHANKDALDTITIAKINTWNNKSDFDGNYNNLTNKPTIPSLEGYATESYVDGEIFKLTDGASEALDTVREIGDALNNDADFAGTMTKELAKKAEKVHSHSEYITQHQDISHLATKTQLNNKANVSDIPTKTSQLTNDSGYLTQHQDLSRYALKTEIPTSLPANGGNSATVGGFSIWTGTQSQYDALSSKSNTTIYLIKEV